MKTKNKKAISTLIAVTVAVSILVAFSATASAATTWYVDDDNCPVPGSGTIAEPFCKIQDAIDNASSGDTVLVYDGTYLEALYIDKSLTLKAASTPVIKGSQSVTTNYGARDAVIFVEDATNVVIEGFDIQGQGLGAATKDYGVIFEESSGTIKDCIMSPNTIGDLNSAAIGAWDGSDLTVDSSTIENFGRIGVFYFNGCSGGVYDSTIIGQVYSGAGDVNYGIEVEGLYGACTVEVIGNDIYNSDNTNPSPSWTSAGILLDGWMAYYAPPTMQSSTVTIEDNDIHNNYIGIDVVANSLSYAHYNNIRDNRDHGVASGSDSFSIYVTFDAEYNWWGHTTGPYHPTSWTYMGNLYGPNPGLGDEVSDYVLYDPWNNVKIDIKPDSYPNAINLKSRGKVPVAVLTEGGFDASTVDPKTVVFAGAKPVKKWTMEDVDGDGDLDMLFHFKTKDLLALTEDSTIAILTGSTKSGQPIYGSDTVKIVP